MGGDDSGSDKGKSDADEFLAAIGPVRRLPDAAEAPRPPRRRAAAAMRAADERAALEESHRADPAQGAGEEALAGRREHVAPEILRRLASGQFAIEDEVDLHALGEKAAEALLRRFLGQARDRGHRCVRIVHGKGLHSRDHDPVLRRTVARVVNLRADVLAYASPPAAQGGSGATLVLLARRKPGEQRTEDSRSVSREKD